MRTSGERWLDAVFLIALTLAIAPMVLAPGRIVPGAVWIVVLVVPLWWRRSRLSVFIVPLIFSGVALVLQYVSLYFLLGPENFARFWTDFSAASGPQVRVFLQPEAVASALIGTDFRVRGNTPPPGEIRAGS